MSSSEFIQGLVSGDLASLRGVPKADFHNHGSLGFHLDVLRRRTGAQIPDPPYVMHTFVEFLDYLKEYLQELLYSHDGFIASIDDCMRTARDDGIRELEISIDCQIFPEFLSVREIIASLRDLEIKYPEVAVRPEVGINREWDAERIDAWVVPLIESGYFAAVDLYGNEQFGEPEEFVRYYALARSLGMRCKAHAGEYRDADFVKRSVEVLELDEVQHGISAASSPAVMRWLADHNIRLNVCPTSNLRLGRIARMSEHPIRALYDAGIHVTVNSDDILVFNQTVSEEFMNLYSAGVMTAAELDEIRLRAFRNGLAE